MDIESVKRKRDTALAELAAAEDAAAIEAVRVRYLGRHGLLPALMKDLKRVPPESRPAVGREINAFKTTFSTRLKERTAARASSAPAPAAASSASMFDGTLPGVWPPPGSRHPVHRVIEDVTVIFASLGFTVADGPDIETEYHNFDALNTPDDHPSRDIQDTFWLDKRYLLRTQTSPVQIRVMERQKPPVRIIAPGRCYRRDATDATHSANFHQVEGLYVAEHVSMADLKGDIAYFARRLMGPGVQVRFRPHFFPFTEPSVEYDFSCHRCKGRGCRLCKQSGWIEISGAGMVHPNVFRAVGYDPQKVRGYAFGMGIERIAMIKYGIEDIRLLYENDVRWLEQLIG